MYVCMYVCIYYVYMYNNIGCQGDSTMRQIWATLVSPFQS